MGPTIPYYCAFNPGIAAANAEQIWGMVEADVIRNGTTPKDTAEKAFKQIDTILAKYPIAQV